MSDKEIDEELFKYVDEYARSIDAGEVEGDGNFDQDWEIFTFCQLFFDQFFGQFGTNIRGFTQRSREAAVLLIETLKAAGQASKEVRELVVLYEEFCDMRARTGKGYGAPSAVSVQAFHEEYLVGLLTTAEAWASAEGGSIL